MRSFRAALAALLIALSMPAWGRAAGSIDVSASASGLSSPGGAYGPWFYERLDVQLPPAGATGLHFENRRASDRFNPNTEHEFSIDRSVRLGRGLTGYAAAQFGSGAPYVRDRFAGELDATVGRGLVLFTGGSLGSGYGVGSLSQLSAGAYYYFGDDYLSFRYTPVWSSVLGSMRGYQAALSLGHPQGTTETLRVGTGGEYDVSLISPVNPTLVGERELGASLSVKHWLSAERGFHVDLEYGRLDRTGGRNVYTRTGLGAGFFWSLP